MQLNKYMLKTFHNEMVKLSESNYETRLALESQYEETHIQKMQDAIDRVVEMIINGEYQQSITVAASKGYRRCKIFEFDTSCKQYEFPMMFLFYGPKKDSGHGKGLKFFQNLEIDSVMKKLSIELSPFKLSLSRKMISNKLIHTLNISW